MPASLLFVRAHTRVCIILRMYHVCVCVHAYEWSMQKEGWSSMVEYLDARPEETWAACAAFVCHGRGGETQGTRLAACMHTLSARG